MPDQFLSPEGDLENYFVTDYWIIDQYIGDTLYVWGNNNDGILGTNDVTPARSTPVTTFAGGTNWKQASTGRSSLSAAIKTDGTLWTWGYNLQGTLGTNDNTDKSTPVTTFAGGTNWKQVSCSTEVGAIKTDGTLWMWGVGNTGQLGTNDLTARSTPVTTFAGGTDWKQVSCGEGHVAAIKTDGTLWVWGTSGNGQLGTNDTTPNRSTPVTTFAGGTDWKQVSAGNAHTAAVKTDGTLWTWGLNNTGQRGTNDTTNRSTPVTTFAGGTDWKQVSAGNFHTAAIKTDGTLWLWGYSFIGQLGTNDTTPNRSTPVTTFAGGTNWKQVSAGGAHTTAVKTDGTLWTWGYNSTGHLGTNDLTNRSTPVTTFAGGNNWRQLSAGYKNTIAVTTGISPELPLA